jgi:hypothetical protein
MSENKDRWMELCAQAAVEQDPQKLLVLVQEINRLLEEKETRARARFTKPADNPLASD